MSSVAIWTSLGSRPADSAPCLMSARYSASDSSVSQLAITPSATSAAVPTIFGPRPASQIGGAAGQMGNAARAHGQQSRRARVEVDDRGAEADCLRLPRQHGEHGESVLA